MALATMKRKQKPASNTKTAAPKQQATDRTRRIRLPAPKAFRFKRVKHPGTVPNVWQLSRRTFQLIADRPWVFVGIAAVYGVLCLLFVHGAANGVDVTSLKQQLSSQLTGHAGQLAIGVSVFTSLLANMGGSSDPTAGVYQVLLGILASLAIIWALRQVTAGERIRVRDAYYKGMYPLVPFMLVLGLALIELLPMIVGVWLYNVVTTYGIAIYPLEKTLWALLALVLTAISAYFITSSTLALYIVTLPDMAPIRALKNAKQLVQYRRALVFRKLVFMPVALLVIGAVVMLPFILFAAPVAPWVFFILATCALPVFHAYLYTLYKALL